LDQDSTKRSNAVITVKLCKIMTWNDPGTQ